MSGPAHHGKQRTPRRGGRPHAVLYALVRAGHGLRTVDLNTVAGQSAPSNQTSKILCELRDHGYTRLDADGLWHATAAGTTVIVGQPAATAASSTRHSLIHDMVSPRRPIVIITERRELPLVLRPGAEDYRRHPSRRGNTLVWDHSDGRVERVA